MKKYKISDKQRYATFAAKEIMNTKEAAAYLSVSESFLEKDRVMEGRIPFCIIGKRGIRYRKADLDIHLEKHLRISTSHNSSEKERHGKD